jgi:hypothetical protein
MKGRPLVSENPPEQHFIFVAWAFDIRAAQLLLRSHPRETIQTEIISWARVVCIDDHDSGRVPLIGGPDLDRAYAMTTNLDEPLIIATLQAKGKDPEPLLIDGWHRVYRAHTEGLTHLPAFVLTLDESLAIRCHVRELRR